MSKSIKGKTLLLGYLTLRLLEAGGKKIYHHYKGKNKKESITEYNQTKVYPVNHDLTITQGVEFHTGDQVRVLEINDGVVLVLKNESNEQVYYLTIEDFEYITK